MKPSSPEPSTETVSIAPLQIKRQRFLSLIKSRLRSPTKAIDTDVITPQEERVEAFALARVSDTMIPRVDIQALEMDTPLSEVIAVFAECALSRLPVYVDTLDDPRGFIHIKSILKEAAAGSSPESKPLPQLIHEALYVPPSMFAADLFLKMQASRVHLALVVDEFGGTDGIVTLKDLVEEIVGDIVDEHDSDEETLFTDIGKNVWDVDARMEVEGLHERIGFDINLPETETSVETLGGIMFALAGRVPLRGEIIHHPNGIEMEVLDADPRRIRRVRLRSSVNISGAKDFKDKTQNEALHEESDAKNTDGVLDV